MTTSGQTLAPEDREGLARLLASETSDRAAWPYILSAAKHTADARRVSIAHMLRTRRKQAAAGGVWKYEGPAEVAGWGHLIEDIDGSHRWVRWASTYQDATSATRAAVADWESKGQPDPVAGFHATTFHESPTTLAADQSAEAARARGRAAWTSGRWVFEAERA